MRRANIRDVRSHPTNRAASSLPSRSEERRAMLAKETKIRRNTVVRLRAEERP